MHAPLSLIVPREVVVVLVEGVAMVVEDRVYTASAAKVTELHELHIWLQFQVHMAGCCINSSR